MTPLPVPVESDQAPSGAEPAGAGAPDDSALLARLRAGESAAFDEVVAQMGPRMLSVARRMLTCEEDARDAVQDAFLSAFRGLAKFGERARLSTWLHRIVVNACLMKLRSKQRRPQRSIEELLPTFLADGHQAVRTRPWKPAEESRIETVAVRQRVRAAIDELPDTHRTVLILRDIEGLSTEEAATVLNVTPNAVKVRLHRARQALRTLLEPMMTQGHS